MSAIVYHPSMECFGLYPMDFSECGQESKKAHETILTIANILGWIPIIGVVVGAFRLHLGLCEADRILSDNEWERAQGYIARGICEILCLGPLLAIVDLIITVARLCIGKPLGMII